MKTRISSPAGFTLVELMVTMVIMGILGTAILNLYTRSSRTYTDQLEVVEAQQNVRAGVASMLFDLRMAGFDPTESANAGFLAAADVLTPGSGSLQFTLDRTGSAGDPDGDVSDSGENITYTIYNSAAPVTTRLGRNDGGNQPVAEYLDALGLAYAFDSDGDGSLDTDASGNIHWAIVDPAGGAGATWFELDSNNDGQITAADDTNGNGLINSADSIAGNPPVDTGIIADLADIRAVKIWLLGHGAHPSLEYTNTNSYLVGSQIFTMNDNFRRSLLTTSVLCRNMGL